MIGEPRHVRGVVVRLLTAGLFAALGSGCGDDSCPEGYACAPLGGGGQGNGGGGPGGGGEGGEGGGIAADCAPTEGVAVGASCGVFVQEGSVEVSAGTSLFGGFACESWTYSAGGARPLILGEADVPAMRITGAGSSRVMSLDLEAPSAEAAGASSLGLWVSEATVELEAVGITAGDGAAGAAPPAQVEQLARAQGGMTGAVAGTVPVNAMGAPTPAASWRCRGVGGAGADPERQCGMATATPAGGEEWGHAVAAPRRLARCTDGGNGGLGSNGNPGLGATSLGFADADGFTAADGEPGEAGTYGHSGGGGGGSRASASSHGAGGGGGGAGGCGGEAGAAGRGGGSSLGIVSLNATLTLGDGVTVTVGSGGAGGAGGMGQFGQLGGPLGPGGTGGGGISSACSGGAGGDGGAGGNGGGGRGGHAVGIAYVGAEPAGGTVDVGGSSEGVGGPGGDNGLEPGGAGADGVVEQRLEL
ncbi:MAG: hypothetical protein IPM79_04440 [Polyangiaceae bacterium]|nr:hypothetical protein [Polyangiaceae bacterium]